MVLFLYTCSNKVHGEQKVLNKICVLQSKDNLIKVYLVSIFFSRWLKIKRNMTKIKILINCGSNIN